MTVALESRKISARHYQALCGLALATIFLLQMQQNMAMLVNVMMLFVGAVCILVRIRLSPLLIFIAIAAGQLFEQYNQNQSLHTGFSRHPFLNLGDVLLCIAVLAYVIGQYRLNGLRFGVLADTRPAAIPARSEDSLSAAELAALIFPVPLSALAGQFALLLLSRNWGMGIVDPPWRHLLPIAWTLLLGIFLTAHAFRYWRRTQMTRAMALLMLQDILWSETGGEQRRIERWIAWRKLSK